jgi:hypothetical protein
LAPVGDLREIHTLRMTRVSGRLGKPASASISPKRKNRPGSR